MTRIRFSYVTILLGYLSLLSCANISSPQGGAQDKTAPRIVRSNMKDSMLNFKADKLEFEFDEFVQLKDVQNQLIISPLLKSKPKVTSHKRKVTVYLPDSLLTDNTTYSLSFGNAIQDLHEGNALENLKYTFSTGSYLDTLQIKGKVMHAKTGLADTSSWVGLYNTASADSDFFNKKPIYLSKVRNGLFQIDNLPNKSFTLFALQDANMNLRYDSIAEALAFFRQPVQPLKSDTIVLYLFKEAGRILDTNTSNKTPLRGQVMKAQPLSYSCTIDTVNKTKRTFGLKDTIRLKTESSFKILDKTKIRLYQDSVLDATSKIEIDSSMRTIQVLTDWEEEKNYTLTLLDGFAKDTSGKEFKGAEFSFKTKRKSDYGFLHLTQSIQPNTILYLYKQLELIAKVNQTDSVVTFSLLTPGDYRLEILHDDNGNGQWDTGKFSNKQMPEILERIEQSILIKANWENKIDIRKTSTSAIKK